MNLFTRKVRTICMCNVMVPFVCTGFLGIKTGTVTLDGSTTDEAHEISLTASDTEPVSQYWEGDNKYAFITNSIEAVIDQQEFTGPQRIQGDENDFAFISKSIKAVIEQRDSVLAKEKTETKTTSKKTTKKTTSKSASKTTTTSVVEKKEVASGTTTYDKPSTTNKTGEAIVEYAKKFKGLKYSSGKQSLSSGADCSGFTMLIYKEFGISLPRSVGGQLGKGKAVSKSNLQKGDLVFFKKKGCKNCGASHVSIYIGGGQVIHETRPGRGVAITGIDGLSNIQFIGARRIINSSTAKVDEPKKEETKTDTTINVTPSPTPIIVNEEKNENINNNVTENEAVTVTPTPTTSPLVEQEVQADIPNEEGKVEEVKEEKEESKVEEVVETPISDTESN